ncbi:hypothetical protein C5S30_06950 [ANME-1 cluster archaeon GoMg4]|nr:hypothetical protein [ANME-1 cluster archaeon GoMg4]
MAAGTYNENLIINKNNLTLQGEDKDNTIINSTEDGKDCIRIELYSNITVENFTIKGSKGTSAAGVRIHYNSDYNTITNNIVCDNEYAGIWLSDVGESGVDSTPQYNSISNNKIYRNGQASGYGLLLQQSSDSGFHTSITGNDIYDNRLIALWASDNTLTGNNIHDNVVGIWVNAAVSDNEIHYNAIYDNTYWGIWSTEEIDVDATLNYWGDATGPANAANPSAGLGNAVIDNVNFMPWYATPTTTPTTENVSVDHPDSSIIAYSDTIQGGIDAACPGDTVNVAAGTYDEQVVIDKALTLQGAGDTTIIQPSSLTTYVTTREAQSSTVATGVIVVNTGGSNVIIKNLTVDASSLPADRTLWFSPTVDCMRFGGVFYYNTSGTIDNVVSTNTNHITIVDPAGTWGRQIHAFWADANETSATSIEIKTCTASNYLSEGIKVASVDPTNITANIHHNIIAGDGLTDRRQNGIQVYYGTTVTAISYNTISNLVYGPNNWATAVTLARGVQFGAVVEHNIITNCDFGISDVFNSGVTIQHNNITGSDHTYGTGIYLDNGQANLTGITVHGNTIGSGFPLGGICLQGWYVVDHTVSATISNNTLTGDGLNDGYGMFDWSGASGSAVTATISGNTITGWNDGIFFEAGPPVTGYTIHCNNIYGNTEYGVKNNDATVLDAENNWWGDASGPTHASNPGGTGDAVTDNVDYDPWYDSVLEPTQSGETATGTGEATFTSSDGNVRNFTAVAEEDLPPEGKPDLNFPHGFFSFDICCLEPSETVIVTIELPDNVPVGTQYWKYHASEGGWIQIPMGSDDGDNVITITLVDGELGDDDGLANGLIVDSGGPGSPPERVPALTPIGVIALIGILSVVLAVATMRKRE